MLRREAGAAWTVTSSDLKPALTLPASVNLGDTLRVGPHAIVLLPAAASDDISAIELQISPRYETRRSVESRAWTAAWWAA